MATPGELQTDLPQSLDKIDQPPVASPPCCIHPAICVLRQVQIVGGERLSHSWFRPSHFASCSTASAAQKPSFRRIRLIRESMSTFMVVIMSTFGKRMRQLRLRKKLSQERLAELAGLHVTFVGAIERGKRNLSLVTIVKLAKALKVKPGELFRGIRT